MLETYFAQCNSTFWMLKTPKLSNQILKSMQLIIFEVLVKIGYALSFLTQWVQIQAQNINFYRHIIL